MICSEYPRGRNAQVSSQGLSNPRAQTQAATTAASTATSATTGADGPEGQGHLTVASNSFDDGDYLSNDFILWWQQVASSQVVGRAGGDQELRGHVLRP
jgi:hypothetical protein